MKDVVDLQVVLDCSKRILAHLNENEKELTVETIVAALRISASSLDEARNANLAAHSRAAMLGNILNLFRK